MEIPWIIKEQTELKLKILRNYIAPWASILFKQAKKIGRRQHLLYIDGFCGPGMYYEDENRNSYVDGSPIIVANIANELIEQDSDREFDLICIDKKQKCFDLLEPKLNKLNKHNQNWLIKKACFEDEINKVLYTSALPPTFCFVDPFGYSIDIKIIRNILLQPMSEVFINFMIYDVVRAFGNNLMDCNLLSLFGDEDYKKCSATNPEDRQAWFLNFYCQNLKKYTNAEYVLPFRVNSPMMKDRPRFYLIHLSNNIKALKTMKNAMIKFSTTEYKLEALGKKENELCVYDIFDEISFKDQIYNYVSQQKFVGYMTLEDWAYENTCGVSRTIKQKLIELEKENKIQIDRLKGQRKSTVNGKARIKLNE